MEQNNPSPSLKQQKNSSIIKITKLSKQKTLQRVTRPSYKLQKKATRILILRPPPLKRILPKPKPSNERPLKSNQSPKQRPKQNHSQPPPLITTNQNLATSPRAPSISTSLKPAFISYSRLTLKLKTPLKSLQTSCN